MVSENIERLEISRGPVPEPDSQEVADVWRGSAT